MGNYKKMSLILMSIVLSSCGAESNVALVKNGSFDDYNFTTIGNAFDAFGSCDSTTWESFETDNGTNIVEYTCTIIEAKRTPAEDMFTLLRERVGSFDKVNSSMRSSAGVALLFNAEQLLRGLAGEGETNQISFSRYVRAFATPTNLNVQFTVNLDSTFQVSYVGLTAGTYKYNSDLDIGSLIDVIMNGIEFQSDFYDGISTNIASYASENDLINLDEAIIFASISPSTFLPATPVHLNSEDAQSPESELWYRLAAEQGVASAQTTLGFIYKAGLGVDQNYQEAMKFYRLAAEQGDIDAQSQIGVMYYQGLGVDQSYQEAVEWFTLAADRGAPVTQLTVGDMHYEGLGVDQSYQEADKWYRLAAKSGNLDAMSRIGSMYLSGTGVDQSYQEAYEWFRLATNKTPSSADALFNLGKMYYEGGLGVEKNNMAAHNFFTATIREDRTYHSAYFMLALTYEIESEEWITDAVSCVTEAISIAESVGVNEPSYYELLDDLGIKLAASPYKDGYVGACLIEIRGDFPERYL